MKFDVWLVTRPDFGNDNAVVFVSPVSGPLISASMLVGQHQITTVEIETTISQLQQELQRREHTNL